MARLSAALLPFALLAACSGADATDVDAGGAVRDDGGSEPAALLELRSADSVTLTSGDDASFSVRYTEEDGSPIEGARVDFALVGRAHDSSLASLDAITDSDGVAVGGVIAGSVPAAFRVRISAERAVPVHVDVSVGDAGFGGLHVTVDYDGERRITERAVHVFAGGAECGGDRTLDEAGDRIKTLVGEETEARFFALPAGITYAVVARGRGPSGEMLAWGCIDGVGIEAEASSEVTVVMRDLLLVVDGDYSVEAEVDAEAPVVTLAARLGDSGADAVAAAGGESTLMLDAIEDGLRAGGMTSEADAIATERIDADLDAALANRFETAGTGPLVAIEALAAILERRVERVAITGALDVTDGVPTWSMSAVSAVSGDPDSARLVIDLAAVGVEPSARMSATWLLDEDAMRLDELRAILPLGSVGLGAMSTIADERGVAGLPELLLPDAGCTTLRDWAAEHAVISTVCDDSCVLMACKDGMETIAAAIEAGLMDLDGDRAVVTLSGHVSLTDAEGDLRVDSMSGAALSGRWSAPDETESDAVTGTFNAARMIE